MCRPQPIIAWGASVIAGDWIFSVANFGLRRTLRFDAASSPFDVSDAATRGSFRHDPQRQETGGLQRRLPRTIWVYSSHGDLNADHRHELSIVTNIVYDTVTNIVTVTTSLSCLSHQRTNVELVTTSRSARWEPRDGAWPIPPRLRAAGGAVIIRCCSTRRELRGPGRELFGHWGNGAFSEIARTSRPSMTSTA